MAFEHARRFAELTRRKRRLEGLLAKIEDDLRKTEPRATEEMIEAGAARVSFGDQRLYFGTLITASAKGADVDKMRRAFARIGLGSLVALKPNIQGIKAHIREQRDMGIPIHKTILKYVQVGEIQQLRCVVDGGKPPPLSMDEHLGEGRL